MLHVYMLCEIFEGLNPITEFAGLSPIREMEHAASLHHALKTDPRRTFRRAGELVPRLQFYPTHSQTRVSACASQCVLGAWHNARCSSPT